MTAQDIEQVVFAALQQHGLSRALCTEAARAVRVAAEDAAKGGEDPKRELLQEVARACRGLGPITPAVEAVVGHAAEDAAKYRAAVERAKDATGLTHAAGPHSNPIDCAHWVVTGEDLHEGAPFEPETLGKAMVREVLESHLGPQLVRAILRDLGLTIDTSPGGTGGTP